jgi:hypothetical protein
VVRPTVLGQVAAGVAGLEVGPGDRLPGYRHPMAPARLRVVLGATVSSEARPSCRQAPRRHAPAPSRKRQPCAARRRVQGGQSHVEGCLARGRQPLNAASTARRIASATATGSPRRDDHFRTGPRSGSIVAPPGTVPPIDDAAPPLSRCDHRGEPQPRHRRRSQLSRSSALEASDKRWPSGPMPNGASDNSTK